MDTPSTQQASGPAPLGRLLSESFAYYKAHWQSLAVGAVIFGVVTGLVGASVATHAGTAVMQGMDQMGIDTDRMQQLADRMEQGDEAAMDELEEMLAGQFEGMSDEQIANRMAGPMRGMVGKVAPAFGAAALIGWIISMLAYAYYALVAVEGKDVNGTFSRATRVMLPLFGLSLWTMLRTFIWIPVLGLIPAIILGPRFVAGPLLFLTEGKGVTASVSESYRRTRGYWGKIVGNVIVAALVGGLALAVANMVLGILLGALPLVLVVAAKIAAQFLSAWMAVFSVRLSQTVLQHPRA